MAATGRALTAAMVTVGAAPQAVVSAAKARAVKAAKAGTEKVRAAEARALEIESAMEAATARDVAVDLTAAPRAVISTAAGLLYLVGCSVLGADRMPTARDNAWAAVCADRERAQIRAEAMRVLSN